jgi:YD repeat-containing protein
LPNSYGDPLEIIYPDGGKATFAYATNGRLLEETDPDGLKTSYSYDPIGRVIFKKQGSYETNYTYDAYHLIEEKDPLEISTYYAYNLAHQKIKQERDGIKTYFSYDPLGFLASESRSDRKTSFQNDVLGRAIRQSIDGVLETIYTYNPAGKVASISNGDPIYFFYDPYDRLVEKINADGAKTEIYYEEGEKILTKKIKDPRGVESQESYNAHGLLVRKEVPDALIEEFEYDNALRLTPCVSILVAF